MNSLIRRIIANAPRALVNPRRAAHLVARVLPFSVLSRDPVAYHVVASWTFGRAERRRASDIFPGLLETDISLVGPLNRREEVSVSVRELVVLAAIVRHLQPRRLLEIGTADGNTTANLAANAFAGHVTTVDLPPRWQGELALEIPPSMANVTDRGAVGAAYRSTPWASRIRQVYGDTATLDWSTLGGPFDFIFIDGCHAYEYVLRDSQNALARLAPDGIVVWHDYGTIEDVSRAVDELADATAIASTSLAIARRPRPRRMT